MDVNSATIRKKIDLRKLFVWISLVNLNVSFKKRFVYNVFSYEKMWVYLIKYFPKLRQFCLNWLQIFADLKKILSVQSTNHFWF